jgi:hypothetical protein
MRIVIVIKNLGEGRYQASLRKDAGSNVLFFSRRQNRTSGAKRDAEALFGPLEWQAPPESLKRSEPDALQVAYWNG